MPTGNTLRRVGASLTLLLPLVGSPPLSAQDPTPGRVDWTMVDTIVSRIEAPRIPARIYRVADFGAVGDGAADARPGILAAIAKATAEGGGRVVLSPGVWLSRGPIRWSVAMTLAAVVFCTSQLIPTTHK